MVVGGRSGDQVSDSRVSLTAWLDDNRHPLVAAASRRVAAITGLFTNVQQGEAEQFQVSAAGRSGRVVVGRVTGQKLGLVESGWLSDPGA